MTSYDLKTILAEELARVGERFDQFGKPVRRARFDSVLPGFGVRTYASGRKVYVLQARIAGKQRLITIGNAAVIGEHAAKDVARRLILRVELGMDPAADKQRGRATPSYSRFLEYYWQTVSPGWKPSTRTIHGVYRRTHLDHAFKGKFLDEIDHADALRWHAGLTRSAGPGAANRAMEILKAMFNKAERWGYLPEHSNPFNGVKRNRQRKIERFLSEDEMRRLGKALAQARRTHPLQSAALTLLALTGCRRGEIIHLKWPEVKGRRLKLTDSKTGPRLVWLGTKAQAVLAGLPRKRGEDRVFPFERRPGSTIAGFWGQMRKQAGLQDVRLHDLRHNYASYAARSSETLPMIGKLLGHSRINSTERYAHLDDETLLRAAAAIGEDFGSYMSGTETSPERRPDR
jgi:integrase